jgi:hypothetical protein
MKIRQLSKLLVVEVSRSRSHLRGFCTHSSMQSSRKKSCKQCRLSKTRCSLSVPHCSRCERRNLSCTYEHGVRNEAKSPSGNGNMFHSWIAAKRSPMPEAPEPNIDPFTWIGFYGISGCPMIESRISEMPHFGMELGQTIEETYRVCNSNQSAFPVAEELPEIGAGGVDQSTNRISMSTDNELQNDVSWFDCGPSAADGQNDRTIARGQPISITDEDGASLLLSLSTGIKRSSAFVLASWPELKHVPQSFPNLLTRKPMTKIASIAVSNFLWATIKSYAVSFSEVTLPPFVHRSSFMKHTQFDSGEALDLPEPLANCNSIVPMFLKKTAASRNIVLRTLLLEVQRLHDEVRGFAS